MNFEKLRDFITKQMRMSQIYQPVMLIELLQNGGMASRDQIAKAILSHDSSQIEYYEHITLNMVGKVLTNNRGITERNNRDYYLKGFDNLKRTSNCYTRCVPSHSPTHFSHTQKACCRLF